MARTRAHVFPLVPRRRLVGIPFGEQRSARRGPGTDVAGSRPYEPGDPVAAIDWYATARLSAAYGRDEFVVHTRYADEAPRVAIVLDRRPAMGVYAPPFPWLSKPAAAAAATHAIAASAFAARAELAYLDLAGGGPFWLPPGSRAELRLLSRRTAEAPFDAPEESVARGLDFVLRRQRDLPPGAFVFILSDFLAPPPARLWVRALTARWDPVPVVIQDPTWEQSFPEVGGVVVPVTDPATGRVRAVRLRPAEALERRRANEERLRRLLARFGRLGIDPVVLATDSEHEIVRAFLAWAERRRLARRVRG